MQCIHLGQQADVPGRVAPHERHGRRTASVLDASTIGELRDAARNLRTGETGYLAQVTPQYALAGAFAAHVTELPERAGHPVICSVAILQRKRDGLVARHKGSHLCQCL